MPTPFCSCTSPGASSGAALIQLREDLQQGRRARHSASSSTRSIDSDRGLVSVLSRVTVSARPAEGQALSAGSRSEDAETARWRAWGDPSSAWARDANASCSARGESRPAHRGAGRERAAARAAGDRLSRRRPLGGGPAQAGSSATSGGWIAWATSRRGSAWTRVIFGLPRSYLAQDVIANAIGICEALGVDFSIPVDLFDTRVARIVARRARRRLRGDLVLGAGRQAGVAVRAEAGDRRRGRARGARRQSARLAGRVALAIKLDSPGPIFFVQPRCGRYGKHLPVPEVPHDDRRTPRLGKRSCARSTRSRVRCSRSSATRA